MPERLPSLPALRVFEAAGRLRSFTLAAAELNVTQAAVSHQIRSLEDQLGLKLFTRSTRSLALTAAGAKLLPAAHAAFAGLEQAIAALRRSQHLLTVTTTPFFSARWLVPRLGRFATRHPDIELSIRHTNAVLDLAAEGIDLAIRGGHGHWPDLESALIAPLVLLPVAAPDYVARLGLHDRRDIARAELLHDETREGWTEWLTTAELDPGLARKGLVFDDEHVLIAAAINGQGVALGMRDLVQDEIGKGTLVPVFDLAMESGWGYHLVHLPESGELPKVRAFRDFVLAEAARDAET